jgi:hypothetical protein
VTGGEFSSMIMKKGSAHELLAFMLERPAGRAQLLAKEARVLALGSAEAGESVGMLISTYSLVDEARLSSESLHEVFDHLNAARAKRGLLPAEWIQLPTKVVTEVAAELKAGRTAPNEGLSRILQDAVQLMQRGVRGWYVQTPSLDDVPWPPELLDGAPPKVMVTATPYKRPGRAWTQYCVIIVALEASAASQT